MPKYCCFVCPAHDYAEKSLDDSCPTCGRRFGFVIDGHPSSIDDYQIVRSLSRGFYGAAFVATRGQLARKCVLKVTPRIFYEFFPKPLFSEEAAEHARLAESAVHIVGIQDWFECDVSFDTEDPVTIPCYVSVLDFVEGFPLREYVDGARSIDPSQLCQIAIDILRIRQELEAHQLNHNDLHAENLIVEELRPEARRPDAISDLIRVMAIDLGSISDESKSGESRDGDIRSIAQHIETLLEKLLDQPAELEDRDYRIALSLQTIVSNLTSTGANLRMPNISDLTDLIRESYETASNPWRPWMKDQTLRGFSDHYNAQTLESWNVPRLLVDPEGRWLDEIAKPGPQVITGMRGCGKTMLLRALDIHARIAGGADLRERDVVGRLESDQYVGLFVSAHKLLDLHGPNVHKLEYRLARLFINFALQACRALLHLKDASPVAVSPGAHVKLANAVAAYLSGSENILGNVVSLESLERQLTQVLVVTNNDPKQFVIDATPAEIFNHLAGEFRQCAPAFQYSAVYYLLDDVSTRHHSLDTIADLLSALLFQSPTCAFKFTSEWQTIELGIRSPGREHPIREGRDISVFDLGASVFDAISGPGSKGKRFVNEILLQRAAIHPQHPRGVSPASLLGDVPLVSVAGEIAASPETSATRKNAYRGISCLTKVCVGDIGDVIKLYEQILRQMPVGGDLPVDAKLQSKCFREMCARRLYELNRRQGYFKDHALAFARASHDLLVRSHKELQADKAGVKRLRQYSAIYVRVTSDDHSKVKSQIDRLRELIDAGVFVFSGGGPRLKTKDSNPIQQFILSFRKIYGLSSYIGLSDRDRFELSGDDLEAWLENPADAKDILIRNQVSTGIEEDDGGGDDNIWDSSDDMDIAAAELQEPSQGRLQLTTRAGIEIADQELTTMAVNKPVAKVIDLTDNNLLPNVGAVLTGLGFEDRGLAANKYISSKFTTRDVFAIRYSVAGHADAIIELWREQGHTVNEIEYEIARNGLPSIDGLVLIDISGLTKPLIFNAIERELREKGEVLVCHSSAATHYPSQTDLRALFESENDDDPAAFLDSLSDVLTGEKGPYEAVSLMTDCSDPSRNRALISFASPKHERLFALLDYRDYDYIEVISPDSESPRGRVANIVASFVCDNYANAQMHRIGTNDLDGLITYLDRQYLSVYGPMGANIEFGLTGSKRQAVAAAVIAATRKVSQAWYLGPKEFDVERFSEGEVGTQVFHIKLPRR